MKKLKFIFIISFLFTGTCLYSQYKGGSYDGYSSQLDTNILYPLGIENFIETVNDFQLYQNYPNPFNPSTIISYSIYKTGYVSLKIFDLRGKELATLIDRKQNAGNYEIEFDAADFPAGVYFYRLSSGNISVTKKMILIK